MPKYSKKKPSVGVELKAGGGLHRSEKPGWSASAQGSDLKKKKMLRHLVSPKGVLLMVLLDLFKVSRMNNFNYDLFKVSKMTNFSNDLFKVSKMTNFNYDQFKVGKTTNSNYDLFKVSKMCFLKLGYFFLFSANA